ncbi:MAG: hypothetical protein SPE74_05875 [Oscillospiraceae bacterium]|nr:hypothetical protein [Oscillospiraceae bacterium]
MVGIVLPRAHGRHPTLCGKTAAAVIMSLPRLLLIIHPYGEDRYEEIFLSVSGCAAFHRRAGVFCSLAEAADILARDLCDAAERIFAAAPAGPQILSYCGAGRDVYPELLTYATALFLCRHYDHIIENPQTHTLGAADMTALRLAYWELLRVTPVLRDTESFDGTLDEAGQPVILHEYAAQIHVESIALEELEAPLDDFERFRLEVYFQSPCVRP